MRVFINRQETWLKSVGPIVSFSAFGLAKTGLQPEITRETIGRYTGPSSMSVMMPKDVMSDALRICADSWFQFSQDGPDSEYVGQPEGCGGTR
jgi:hypothetical protein